MKKYTLKYVVALTVLTFVSGSSVRAQQEAVSQASAEKEHVEFIYTLIKNTADFIEFSSDWTEKFFDTKNRESFSTFAKQMADATAKFNTLAIKPLNENMDRVPKNSHYHEALRIGKEIACTLYNQAHHVCNIMNKHLNSRNVIKVGIALDETSKYIKTKMIHELEEKFNRFEKALKKVDPALATHAHNIGKNVIEARKYQHDMSTPHKMRGLHHRLKC